ncbi:MAG: gamma-glutamylcyclotransferase [Chitinophagaceae bacterium]|nr:gamma-glutamylcyclotransferase [Chitinophagaceae bacterium]
MNNIYQLFVYGSLRSGFKSPAFEYISCYFCFMVNGKVKGALYDMGEYPAAKPTEEEQYIVGELYAINNMDEFSFAMAQLDDYEGVIAEDGAEPLFKRETTTVYVGDKMIEAWIYWFNGNTNNKPIIETGDVLKYLEQKNSSL